MKRKLFFLERVLFGDGHAPFNGVFALKVTGTVETVRMVWALERIQKKYCLLRARVEKDEKGMDWFVVHDDTPAIPLKMGVRRGEGDWITESKLQLAQPWEAWRGPLLRVVWLRGQNEHDVILAFHHCLCDGGSAMALMRDLLLLLDEPDADIGLPGEMITIEELFASSGVDRKAKGIAALLRAGLSLGAMLTPTKGKKPIPRSEDYLLHRKLDEVWSAGLVRYCKSAGVTVNTLLCVAALHAFRLVRGEKARQKVTCPVDIRRYHPAIKRDMLFAFGLAVSLSLKKKRGDLSSLVRGAQKVMSARLNKLNAMEFLKTMENSHAALDNMIKVLTYGRQGDDLMFSNMGRLDIPETYGSFVVEAVYSPTVIGPFGNPTTLIASTYRGQLDLSFVSNGTVLREEEGRAIMAKMVEVLSEVAVGIELV